DRRFQLLTGGSRAAVPRQQTLRATLDWSYELLSRSERRLLSSLAVFAGGWSLGSSRSRVPRSSIRHRERPRPALTIDQQVARARRRRARWSCTVQAPRDGAAVRPRAIGCTRRRRSAVSPPRTVFPERSWRAGARRNSVD